MRARLIGALAAGAALITSAVMAAGPAAALPDTWTVDPGGAFHGVAGETLLEVQESGIQLSCASSTADGTAIEADIVGPGCNATVTGSVPVTFTNSTDVLSVQPEFTLVVTFVDPGNNCLGLINEGEHANFSGSYQITPGLTVTSP